MDKAREILEQMPDVKIGLDSFYGQQTVLNALNKALNTHNVVRQREQLKCDCGKPVESAYDPCCSLTCWCEMFEGA